MYTINNIFYKNLRLSIILISIVFTTFSCGIYSFTGASVDPNVKKVSVGFFTNQATTVNPNLSQAFTDALRNKLLRETNLDLVTKNGDIDFSGTIVDYSITAIGRQANQAAGNQLQISVKVDFENKLVEKDKWTQTFTKTATYDASQNLNVVESSLVETINKLLVDEIFNKALANW